MRGENTRPDAVPKGTSMSTRGLSGRPVTKVWTVLTAMVLLALPVPTALADGPYRPDLVTGRTAGHRLGYRDHPVRGDFVGDAPSPVGPVRAFGGFDVLAGDQRQQRHRLSSLAISIGIVRVGHGHRVQERERVGHQRLAGLLVVPGDGGLARVGVVMRPAAGGDDLAGAGDRTAHPADRGDQLGDGVLGGDRVIQYQMLGFSYDRPKGKGNCVMTKSVSPLEFQDGAVPLSGT
jgi:hypothetical protein